MTTNRSKYFPSPGSVLVRKMDGEQCEKRGTLSLSQTDPFDVVRRRSRPQKEWNPSNVVLQMSSLNLEMSPLNEPLKCRPYLDSHPVTFPVETICTNNPLQSISITGLKERILREKTISYVDQLKNVVGFCKEEP